MRALHVIPVIAPRYGGPSEAIVGMCRALLDTDVDVLIATSDGDGRGHLPVVVGEVQPYRDVPTIFFRRRWSDRIHVAPNLVRWVNSHVASFDVVHIHAIYSFAGPATARACRRLGTPYVVRTLGHLDPWSLRHGRLRKWAMLQLLLKPMLQGAAAIQYTTHQEKRLAERALALGHGVVIPLGVDERLLDAPDQAEQFRAHFLNSATWPYVLVLSRLHPVKGLESFIEVFLEVTAAQALRHWHLVIAGDGAPGYAAELKNHAAALEGSQRVAFTGWVGGQDRTAALQGAALMALPSHQESFGLSAIEALAVGVPVLISTEVNLADEVNAARAGWVAPLDKRGLAAALNDALRDESERARRGRAGRELVQSRFTWPVVAERLLDLYRSITSPTN